MEGIRCTALSDRTRILTFDDNISVVLILGENHTFLCDTHLGPDSMAGVELILKNIPHARDMIIFNSHSDWDHIWGNCAFPDSMIIGHTTCHERMKERGYYDLSHLESKTRGHVILKLPTVTFDTRLCFEDDKIVFMHAPGHTIDSSVCYDQKDNILYIGDLVEDPIPYIDYCNTDRYLKTLDMLLNHPAEIMVSAHSGIISRDLIRRNIAYIKNVAEGQMIDTRSFGEYAAVHELNRNMLLLLTCEERERERLQNNFDFSAFWSRFPHPEAIPYDELRQILKAGLGY